MESFLAQVNHITERLVVVTQTQHLIEKAETGYFDYYQDRVKQGYTQSEYIPYTPNEIQMQFWRQILYFRCGLFAGPHDAHPYVDTSMYMFASNRYFGEYSLFTFLDGSDDDDLINWRMRSTKVLPEVSDWPEYPVDDFDEVPDDLREIFPLLNVIVETQKLEQLAEQRCVQWFTQHPDWDQNYPQSLLETPHPREVWFREHPNWFQMYPKRPFPPKRHKITIGFNRLLFCFNHSEYPNPHFLTRLRIYAGKYEIGGYTLATSGDGEVIEELSGIYPYPYSF